MATPTLLHSTQPSATGETSIKELSDSGVLSSLPSRYASRNPEATDPEPISQEEEQIPTIDFSILTGGTPDQRSQAIRELGRACQEWGFFMVVNHGVPERLREAVMGALEGFFDLTEEEKREYAGKHVMDPIRFGTSFNSTVEDVRYWRDYLKVIVHPVFHSIARPPGFREILQEYSSSTRELARGLLKGIWQSLKLEESSMDRALDLDSCLQIFVGNLYPPCPQPELAIGLPPHSDHGLLTMLVQNGVDGLQVKHNGRWVHVINPLPNAFLVNTGDHMEIVSNGRYRSVLHRATVNSKSTRMSIATVVGPSPDTLVVPALQYSVSSEGCPLTGYRGMKYRDFIEYQQGNQLKEKSVLDLLRIPAE